MLDEYQKEAVCHKNGPCLVIAGPGSGKTKCIAERIACLKNNGVPPEKILVITFTREAASEMEMRYIRDHKDSRAFFCTFHSLFYHILTDRFGTNEKAPQNSDEQKKFFDGLIDKTKELFESETDVLKKWQERFLHILVDEFQDIDEKQFEILLLLLGEKKNIFAVGDDDQSIYSFRGSSPRIMIDFTQYFPDAKIYILKRNYRSARKIVEASKRLISNNKLRYEKDYEAYTLSSGRLYFRLFSDDMAECEYVIKRVKDVISTSKDKTIGILFRNRYQSELIREYLVMEQISFYSGEKLPSIRRHFVFKDICAGLKVSLGLGDESDEIRAKAVFSDNLRQNAKIVSKLSVYAGINYLCKGAGYDNYLHKKAGGNKLYEHELMSSLERVKLLFSSARTKEDFLLAAKEDEVTYDCDKKGRVGLFTFHGSKGLEFDEVIILDANEGITPSLKAEGDMIEEERRMFYVALTRAKRGAEILTVERRNKKRVYPSRFIEEMQTK